MGAPDYHVYQVRKYIKIPDRRLISGLLSVNVGNHVDNDDEDDYIQAVYDNWSGLDASVKNAQPFNNEQTENPGRSPELDAGYPSGPFKHTFADYDCFLFYVCGGMTLHDATVGGPVSGSGLTDYANTVGTWYKDLRHTCQHFVKHHLLSRINNAAGFNIGGANPFSDTFMNGTPVTTNTYEVEEEDYTSDSATIVPTSFQNQTQSRRGLWTRHILSHGNYDTYDTLGADINSGPGNGYVPGNDLDPISSSGADTENKNTYFNPVDRIKIYGLHNMSIAQNTYGGADPDNNPILYQITSHETDFWSLVLDIGIRGSEEDYAGDGSQIIATQELIKSRINVFFQPFGETANFDFSDELHTE